MFIAKNNIKTTRLLLKPLAITDVDFMQVLTNTEGWLHNIGDRNTATTEGALAYINKILAKRQSPHWVINLNSIDAPIGIVSYIKKEHLHHFDIGFALLPAYMGKGYAQEAAKAVLLRVAETTEHTTAAAETLQTNTSSITLLQRLGFTLQQTTKSNEEEMCVFALQLSDLVNEEKMLAALKPVKPQDPLHGKTLENILIELQQKIGWEGMAAQININCFASNPSIKSSLTFLRKTPWARKRVEDLWVWEIGRKS